MAAVGGNARAPVTDSLHERGYAFEFYQAVRILEWLGDRAGDRRRLGRSAESEREAVRFRSLVSLAFPASEVDSVTAPQAEGEPSTVTVAFMGLASGLGPLPRPFTEMLIERIGKRDTALRDFLDVFNHRLVSYLWRAREKHRAALRICPPEESALARQIFSVMGLGEPSLRARLGVPDRALLLYAGLLARPVRTAAGLEGILRHYFELPARVRSFAGRWRTLEPGQWTRLEQGGENRCLGVDAVLGTRIWDQSGTFEVRLGPMGLADFLRFLPGAPRSRVPDGDRLGPLQDLTRLWAGVGLEAEWRLLLDQEEVPGTVLSAGAGASRLGYTSWLTPGGRAMNGEVLLRDERRSDTNA